jgi:hypothetical protein
MDKAIDDKDIAWIGVGNGGVSLAPTGMMLRVLSQSRLETVIEFPIVIYFSKRLGKVGELETSCMPSSRRGEDKWPRQSRGHASGLGSLRRGPVQYCRHQGLVEKLDSQQVNDRQEIVRKENVIRVWCLSIDSR